MQMKLFRRRARIQFVCPHGAFIPATYRPGQTGKLGCQICIVNVYIGWTRDV